MTSSAEREQERKKRIADLERQLSEARLNSSRMWQKVGSKQPESPSPDASSESSPLETQNTMSRAMPYAPVAPAGLPVVPAPVVPAPVVPAPVMPPAPPPIRPAVPQPSVKPPSAPESTFAQEYRWNDWEPDEDSTPRRSARVVPLRKPRSPSEAMMWEYMKFSASRSGDFTLPFHVHDIPFGFALYVEDILDLEVGKSLVVSGHTIKRLE